TGVFTNCNDTTPADLGSGRADERRLVGLTDGGQMTAGCRCLLHFLYGVLRVAVGLGVSVEPRNLADPRGHLGILRCRGEGRAPPRRGTERRQAFGIDIGQRTSKCDGSAPVVQLTRRLVQIWLARAVAKAAIVENQRRDAGGRKPFSERPQTVSARAGQ